LYASRTITEKRVELPLPVSRGPVGDFAALQKRNILRARAFSLLVGHPFAPLPVAPPFETAASQPPQGAGKIVASFLRVIASAAKQSIARQAERWIGAHRFRLVA